MQRDVKIHKYKNIICKGVVKQKNKIFNTVKIARSKKEPLIAIWWSGMGGNNWGDALNPILIRHLSGKDAIPHDEIINFKEVEKYCVIGSILSYYSEKNLVVWGSGFVSNSSKFKQNPKKICAVRGPLTRNLIEKQGINCPEIYGDPALLYPLFYLPNVEKKYKLGIIPHYIDKENLIVLKKLSENHPEILIIDILSGINKVVNEICMCERIASSSLHGIIAADAYKIPSTWIKFSEGVTGNGFKFYDYFASVGRDNEKPFVVKEETTIESIY